MAIEDNSLLTYNKMYNYEKNLFYIVCLLLHSVS